MDHMAHLSNDKQRGIKTVLLLKEMPKKEKPKPTPIRKHTSDYTLSSKSRKFYFNEEEWKLCIDDIIDDACKEVLYGPESRKSRKFNFNEEEWKLCIDDIIDDACKEVLYGPEAYRLALRSIQAAYCDAGDTVLLSMRKEEEKEEKKKTNIFRRFLNFFSCFKN